MPNIKIDGNAAARPKADFFEQHEPPAAKMTRIRNCGQIIIGFLFIQTLRIFH
ncbi:MAG: hypothetical protein J1E07_01990 [Treponema sp.]|nr:hypothetical protein [Treponema sp.]